MARPTADPRTRENQSASAAAGVQPTDLAAMARVVKTLADPTRLRLVQAMTLECRSVTYLVRESGLSQPLVSHHLRILRDAGLACPDRRGSFVFY